MTTRVTFIDARIANAQELIAALPTGTRHCLLQADADGVGQISRALAGNADLTAIDILAHGSPGALQLGSTRLSRVNLPEHADALACIGQALAQDGDLLIYGCETGKGAEGKSFVAALREYCGAHVSIAAASGRVGHADLGGTWQLDVGHAAQTAPLAPTDWRGTLGFTPITSTDSATALAMAAKIINGQTGFTLVSAQYTGALAAAATFDSVDLGTVGDDALTLGAGVLLTSGSGTPASSNTSSSYSTYNGTEGDAGLDAYATAAFSGAGSTNDAAILEFSFTVAAASDGTVPSKISLDFMFGSDEYPEYSDSSYVDIAAIEVDGVNYAYFNQDETQPLSVIDTNLQLGNFIDNTSGIVAIEYDGISSPLRFTASLASGVSTHTIRIAIADTGDFSYDSGIFVSKLQVSKFDTLPDGIYIDGDVIFIDGEDGDGYYGTDEEDTLEGGDGEDTLEGGDGDDTLGGGEAGDTIIGGDGNDTIDGGTGDDSIEGGTGDDTIDGGDGKDTILGDAGDDDIDAGTGDDTIIGGAGDDTLTGGAGKDRMEGGSGADTYYVDNKKDVVFEANNDPEDGSGLVLDVDLGSTIDSVISSVKYTLTNYVENLTLAESTAKLAGTGNALGNEILGNSGANKISGMDGADTIDGGAGADKLAGGAGADTFQFTNIATGGADTISDFADEDTLLFDTSVFTTLAGATAANFVAGTAAADADDFLIFTEKGSALYYDADGSGGGAAVKIVAIKGADAKTITFDDLSFS